jgi:hypothetical protein
VTVPVTSCSQCGGQFQRKAQFCTACGNNLELQNALCDFEYGDFDARVSGACSVARIDKARWQELEADVEAFLGRLKPHYALKAAIALQTNGAVHESVTSILLHNLESLSELDDDDRLRLLNAVSTMRNSTEASIQLKRWIQGGPFGKDTTGKIFIALGAIGEPSNKPFLEYWAIRGEGSATAALQKWRR